MSGQGILPRAYKFRAYPNQGTRRRALQVMRKLGHGPWDRLHEAYRHSQEAWLKVYQPRLKEQEQRLERPLDQKERSALWKEVGAQHGYPITGKKESKYDERIRACIRKRDHREEYEGLNAQMIENVATQFIGSVASYETLRNHGFHDARPPRRHPIHPCLTYRQSGWSLEGHILVLKGVGRFRLSSHQWKHTQILGKIKTVTVTLKNRKWYACFSCEIERNFGACGPAPASKPCPLQNLRRKYTPIDESDPEKGGTCNRLPESLKSDMDESDPEKGGTCSQVHLCTACFDGSDEPTGGPCMHPRVTPRRRSGECRIDFGFSDLIFLSDSEGRAIEHPQFYFSGLDELRRLDRIVANKKACGESLRDDPRYRGANLEKAYYTRAKWHARVAAQRECFINHLVLFYASRYEKVVIPKSPLKLQIQYALDTKTPMQLTDGAYGQFATRLKQKCREWGTELHVESDARYTVETILAARVQRQELMKSFLWHARKAEKYQSGRSMRQALQMASELLEGDPTWEKRQQKRSRSSCTV